MVNVAEQSAIPRQKNPGRAAGGRDPLLQEMFDQ